MTNPTKQDTISAGSNSGALTLWLLRAAFVMYLILIFYGVSMHEPWRDEAQAWLLVRDLSLGQLLKILPSEGHPPLWYLLLMPLAKSGIGYSSQSYLAAIIMAFAVYVFLFRAKMPLLVKVLLPFSYFFLYEYSFFARSYCLIVLLLSLIAALYPRRLEQPGWYALLIILLFNTHVLAFTLAMSLTILFLIDSIYYGRSNVRTWLAFAAMLIGGLYLIPYLYLSNMSGAFGSDKADHSALMLQAVGEGLLAQPYPMFAVLLLCLSGVFLLPRAKAMIILACGSFGVIYILGYKYGGGLRHEGVIYLILLFAVAISSCYENDSWNLNLKNTIFTKYSYLPLAFATLLQIKPAVENYSADTGNPFSDAANVAAFIQDNKLDRKTIIAHQAWAAGSVAPYLPSGVKFYYPECEEYGTYYKYASCYENRKWEYGPDFALNTAYLNFKGRLQDVVFLFNHPVQPSTSRFLDLLYQPSENTIRQDEMFYIYKFKDGVR